MSFRLLPAALADLSGIVLHIADDNPSAAYRWYDTILDRCRMLSHMPGMGVARDEIRLGLRTFPFGKYIILYRQTDIGIDIVRILHSARHWQSLLDS